MRVDFGIGVGTRGGIGRRSKPVYAQKIFCLGDSMSTETYMSALQTQAGIPVLSGGVPGQVSFQITARYGSVPAKMTVAGNQIPASGAVAITSKSASPITSGSANGSAFWLTLNGTLAGVRGVLSRDMGQPAGVDNLTFTRSTPGSAVTCPPNTPFIPDTNDNDRCILIPWMGANNPSQKDQVMSDLEATIAFLKPYPKRFIVNTVINRPTATIGTPEHQQVIDLNNEIMASWPNNYFDVRSYLISQYNPALPDDVTAHDQDIMPPSLSSDGFHPNATGYNMVANQIYPLLVARDYLTFS